MKRWYVLVAGGSVKADYLRDEIDSLLKKAKPDDSIYVIGADAGVKALTEAKIPIDYALGDFDTYTEFDKNLVESGKMNGQILNPIKDDTDSEAAIRHIIGLEQAYSEKKAVVLMYGVTGSRLDHTMANICMLKQFADSGIMAEIRNENNHIRLLTESVRLSKNDIFGTYISLLPLSEKVEHISISGFKYSGAEITLELGSSLGISNELSEEIGEIFFPKGKYILLMETRD